MKGYSRLIKKAQEAQKNSYAPYSKYNVGSALLAKSGKIYTGCNVENASYGATTCAERCAFSSAVSAGEREFVAIAIVAGYDFSPSDIAYPCGVCRQTLSELCDGELDIILYSNEKTEAYKLSELLPKGFTL